MAQAAALAVLDVIEEEGLVERAARDRRDDSRADARLAGAWPAIGDVRGLGAMLAIELVEDPATKQPRAELAQAVIERPRRARAF